ncbi:MAG TPA: DUF222 domain-containing protein [Aeromicrobium sp.]|nr:DUF222 domain-containing protein [Aeromicrobium sp.]
MTLAQLTEAPDPMWLDALEGVLESMDDPARLAPDVARSRRARLARVMARLGAHDAGLIRRIDEAKLAKASGATSTGALLAGDFGGDRAGAGRLVHTARNLERASLTEKALSLGEISYDKAAVVSKAIAELPEELDEVAILRVEKRLLDDAKRLSLPDLRRRVLRVADLYAPRAEADHDEDTWLRHQEARAWQATELWFGPARDGLVAFGGKLPELHAELLKNQIGAIAAPRRNHLNDQEQARADADEDLNFGQRIGRAFCAWIERIPTDGLPTTGGTPATLTVNIDYDALEGKVREAAGMLATGTRVSASEVRRLACSHHILPRVLDGQSQILDQGRSKRVFTPAQRLAMADRDGGCTYPTCDRPPAWTEAHHLDHWAKDGGATDLDRGTLLCARHHHWVHSEDIHIRRRDGRTEFQIHGIWQTNHRWRP